MSVSNFKVSTIMTVMGIIFIMLIAFNFNQKAQDVV